MFLVRYDFSFFGYDEIRKENLQFISDKLIQLLLLGGE